MKNAVFLILTLTKSEICGKKENFSEDTACEKAKILLAESVQTGEIDAIFSNVNIDELSSGKEIESDTEDAPISESWEKNIIRETDEASTQNGCNPNPYFCPGFEKKLMWLLQYYPLWTGVMNKYFQSPFDTASSAIVEADFGI